MTLASIAELVAASRPHVFTLLERATEKITASPHVTHVYVRGSLAAGRADRMSDLDFVAGVADEWFEDFHEALDTFMTTEFNAILPGWRDTIVNKMGGIGYVYLVENDGKLYQLDFYLVPASRAEDVPARTTRARLLHARDYVPACDAALRVEIAKYVALTAERPRSSVELMVELLVLLQMVYKRVRRGQHFSAYGEWVMARETVRDLVRSSLVPTSPNWGWYRLEEELSATPIGRACGRSLHDLLLLQPPTNGTELDSLVERCLHIAEMAAPATVAQLADAIASYRAYLDL
ncbi:hypothetical protein [Catellatospora chokoriensis]|uniref:Nucleotidyltransferase domain-containing protein n=1 Tax=Catellatospora chokoriensis TaxID=310353 RepID=A0A8J3NRD7_9ACTN|nr:hypothetical protein [Catellatospora chokoriensis]GIF89845.1 hypothetical protein Cch02nite_32890 [Catellatospora chokoriensis]